jgi:hypothetical protein
MPGLKLSIPLSSIPTFLWMVTKLDFRIIQLSQQRYILFKVVKLEMGTSYIAPVKRGNEKILSFIKTASYKTLLILGTLFPLNPMTDLP